MNYFCDFILTNKYWYLKLIISHYIMVPKIQLCFLVNIVNRPIHWFFPPFCCTCAIFYVRICNRHITPHFVWVYVRRAWSRAPFKSSSQLTFEFNHSWSIDHIIGSKLSVTWVLFTHVTDHVFQLYRIHKLFF